LIVLEIPMMKTSVALALSLLATASLAASRVCLRDCARQGFDHGYCRDSCR
jgi:hypothetical protein